MIPLIAHTVRLTLLATSRALLTAELHKPQYFPGLLGAVLPADWRTGPDDRAALAHQLALLATEGRPAAGWHGWYALRKADAAAPRTLVGAGGFLGPPDAAGTAELTAVIAADWRGQGLGTELVAGLVQQAAATGMVRGLLARAAAADGAARQVLLRNGFEPAEPAETGDAVLFRRAVPPTG